METYTTKYGKITLYKNDVYIGGEFKQNRYWDEATLLLLREYVDPYRNILEIGGHCGTSSLVYSSYLNESSKLFVYEPQKNMYNLLVHNITQNGLQHKIIPYNLGVFCFEGTGKMNNTDLDGGGGNVSKRYAEECDLNCNFGGIGLGADGEEIQLTTIDSMNLPDIGFIHCDAQGSENFIFSRAMETVKKYKPVIYYENNELYGRYLYDNVRVSYPEYAEESRFDIKKYCIEELGYSGFIEQFNGGADTLLIPPQKHQKTHIKSMGLIF
jgi:FkbM family methyltransferase